MNGNKFSISFSSRAKKDLKKLKKSEYWHKAVKILQILMRDPFQEPPEYEALIGDFAGYYSRRINLQHRIVYILIDSTTVEIASCWTHYHDN